MVTLPNTADTSFDVNSLGSLTAAMVMAVIGPAVFIAQPEWVKGLTVYAGFSVQQAGSIASAEMWGMCLLTVAMTYLAPRIDWRKAFTWALLVVVVGNLITLLISGLSAFIVLRFIIGLGSGVIVSLSFAVVGITANPDRNFGYLMIWVLLYGAVAMSAMPWLYAGMDLAGAVIFFAALSACGLPFLRFLPRSGGVPASALPTARGLSAGQTSMALAAMLTYFLGIGTVWAYVSLMGLTTGASEQQVANGLAISQIAGIGGGLTAVVLAAHVHRALPITLAIIGGIIAMWLLGEATSSLAFAIAVALYVYAWNVTHPYLLAAMASFDASGRVVVYAAALQMLGIAIGPILGAALISQEGYADTLAMGMVLFALSLILIVPPVIARARLHRT